MVARLVENPPAEATPDFAYKPCKGFQAAVIEESQMEEEAGLALRTFTVCLLFCLLALLFLKRMTVTRGRGNREEDYLSL